MESDTLVLALNLEDRAATEVVQPAPQVTPTRLLALLDKAKAFPLLKKQQPDAVAGAEARTFGDQPQITDFNDYEIRIEEVFFNPEDTPRLSRHVAEQVGPGHSLPARKFLRARRQPALLTSPSAMRPEFARASACSVYFAITGTPDGGRNELSLKNDFTMRQRWWRALRRLRPRPPEADISTLQQTTEKVQPFLHPVRDSHETIATWNLNFFSRPGQRQAGVVCRHLSAVACSCSARCDRSKSAGRCSRHAD